jgi:hypothetical protein
MVLEAGKSKNKWLLFGKGLLFGHVMRKEQNVIAALVHS